MPKFTTGGKTDNILAKLKRQVSYLMSRLTDGPLVINSSFTGEFSYDENTGSVSGLDDVTFSETYTGTNHGDEYTVSVGFYPNGLVILSGISGTLTAGDSITVIGSGVHLGGKIKSVSGTSATLYFSHDVTDDGDVSMINGCTLTDTTSGATATIASHTAVDSFNWVSLTNVVGDYGITILAATPMTLENGITVTFASNTGHTGEDLWLYTVSENKTNLFEGYNIDGDLVWYIDSEGVKHP